MSERKKHERKTGRYIKFDLTVFFREFLTLFKTQVLEVGFEAAEVKQTTTSTFVLQEAG